MRFRGLGGLRLYEPPPSDGRRCPLLPFVALAFLALAACAETENPPERLLLDSLGLRQGDAVFEIRLGSVDNVESIRPAELQVTPEAFVEFLTVDGRLHMVRFELDSLSAAAASFLRSTGQDRSPPMLELYSRFVITLSDAPAGRYPYVVEGNGRSSRGAILVEAPAR